MKKQCGLLYLAKFFVTIFLSIGCLVLRAQEPQFFRGDLSPANAAYTINRPGVYKLTSAKTASGVPNILIAANNVTLDLGGNLLSGGTNGIEITHDNVTVKNGAITGMTQNGVLIQGNGCRIESLDISQCTTGITLESCYQGVVESCSVRNTTQAGVSLQGTWTSSVRGCAISGIHGATSVYGVYAQNGGNNSIEQCTVKDVQTSSVVGNDKVVGMALYDENSSTLKANTMQAIDSLTTVSAYGVWVQDGNNAVISKNSIVQVVTNNNVGQGVFVDQDDSLVINNVAYECDISFAGISSDYITSQANARGAYNIDASLTTPDQVEVAGDSVTASASMVAGMVNNMSSITSMVNNRYDCSYFPITASDTGIASSGVYRLAATRNGDFAITATGVTFDMNGRAIRDGKLLISGDRVNVSNGLIRGTTSGSTISGVSLTGNNCNLSDIRTVNCRTGFEVTGATKNTLEKCQALSCTREGFLLTNAQYNTLSDCQVTSVVGTGTIAGIKTTGGVGNEFVDCSVNQVSSTASGDAYGVWGVTESLSQFLANTINDITATAGKATGLMVDQTMWMSNVLSYTWAYNSGAGVHSVDWVSMQPGLAYLAASDRANNILTIFRYDGAATFNLCYSLTMPGDAYAVQWLQAYGNIYLAVSWQAPSSPYNSLQIYLFDSVSETLFALPNAIYQYYAGTTGYPLQVDWLTLSDGRIFLAIAGQDTASYIFQILSFDGANLTVLSQARPTFANSWDIDWLVSGTRIFLAVAAEENSSGYILTICEYDITKNDLIVRATVAYSGSSGLGESTGWLIYNDKIYLALGTGAASSGSELVIFNFNSVTSALTTVTRGPEVNTYVKAPEWLVTGTSIYLAFGAYNTAMEVNVYRFDPSVPSLTQYYTIGLPDTTTCYDLKWYTGTQGRALLAGGFIATSALSLKVFGFDIVGTTSSVIQENTISNVVDAQNSLGTGIVVNQLSEGILSNRVVNTVTPYREYPGWYDPSNQIISG